MGALLSARATSLKLTGTRINFSWPDQNKRLVSLPAPTYIDYVMSWVQKLLDDEAVFPTKSGKFISSDRRQSRG